MTAQCVSCKKAYLVLIGVFGKRFVALTQFWCFETRPWDKLGNTCPITAPNPFVPVQRPPCANQDWQPVPYDSTFTPPPPQLVPLHSPRRLRPGDDLLRSIYYGLLRSSQMFLPPPSFSPYSVRLILFVSAGPRRSLLSFIHSFIHSNTFHFKSLS